MSKNDAFWEELVERYGILKNVDQNGFHEISAAHINQLRGARLMTKFDHKIQLPRKTTSPYSQIQGALT